MSNLPTILQRSWTQKQANVYLQKVINIMKEVEALEFKINNTPFSDQVPEDEQRKQQLILDYNVAEGRLNIYLNLLNASKQIIQK